MASLPSLLGGAEFHKQSQRDFRKGLEFGGSRVRTEATGYGCVYSAQNMLERAGQSLDGKLCVVSGSGNVATHAVEKIIHMGGKAVTLSDSEGFIFDRYGIDREKLQWVKEHKTHSRGRLGVCEGLPGIGVS